MMLKRPLLVIVALVLLVTAEAFWFHAVHVGDVGGDDDDAPIPVPERVSTVDGQRVIALSNRVQVQNGIVADPAQPAPRTRHEVVTGKVRDIGALVELRARYERALKIAPALEDATLRTIGQHYGKAVAAAVAHPTGAFDAIFSGRQSLIDIALRRPGPAPLRLFAHDARGRRLPLDRLAPAEQPRHWFYRADANAGLYPGDTVSFTTPAPSRQAGVVVPAAAVVWHDAAPWCYLRHDGDLFVRVGLARAAPEPGGGYRTTALTTHDEIVVQGAQLLLSEELRARIQTEG